MTIDTTASGDPDESHLRVRHAVRSIVIGLLATLIVLADTLAFNQVATQSPTDGIIQLTVIGVGFAGLVLGGLLLATTRTALGRLLGAATLLLAIAALVGWRTDRPVGVAVILCGASAGIWALLGLRALARPLAEMPRATPVVLLTQAFILVWFAVLVAISARGVLFG